LITFKDNSKPHYTGNPTILIEVKVLQIENEVDNATEAILINTNNESKI